jgi:hypothetical protein
MKKITITCCFTYFLTAQASPLIAIENNLVLALQNDQKHRVELNQLNQDTERKSKAWQQANNKQQQLDEKNQLVLSEIIAQLGHWPTADDVGENKAKIALILFKRASIELQATYLPMILQQVSLNKMPPKWYAELYDHHLMVQDQPQKFGNLIVKTQDGLGTALYPIESIDTVNINRANIGLNSLQQEQGENNWLIRKSIDSEYPFQLEPADKLMKMADLALICLNQTYPNSIKHVLNSAEDAQTPEQLYPTFYGCFDWHSSVHGHWLLVRLAKLFPNHPKTAVINELINQQFDEAKLNVELTYFKQTGRAGFERPYGLAWYLQLYTEIASWDHPQAVAWKNNLTPLKNHIVEQLSSWIPKLAYPIRSGEHSQTAFAFGLAHDYAKQTKDQEFAELLAEHIKRLYLNDQQCPISYEPSGHDFLSPCLAEADLMRRVLNKKSYAKWLKNFLPDIKNNQWLAVAEVTDRTDGKLAHLDGLNLARAWMLEGIAWSLPSNDKRRQYLLKSANSHAQSGLAAVTGEHYAGGHWLGSFATYYLTQRGFD